MSFRKFLERYDAGKVLRYHTVSLIKQQDLAAHSWGVMTIILYLEPEPSPALVRAGLFHDLAESYTGDMPAPTKRANPKIAEKLERLERKREVELGISYELSAHEQLLLKVADAAELVLFCHREANLGNAYAVDIRARGVEYLRGYMFDGMPWVVREFIEEVVWHVC